jgi:hypothetical protein
MKKIFISPQATKIVSEELCVKLSFELWNERISHAFSSACKCWQFSTTVYLFMSISWTQMGGSCKDIVPLIHNLNGGEWSPSRHSRFTSRKGNPLPPVPRPKNRPGLLGEEKNLFSLPGIEHRIVHPVASSLYCLRCPEVSVVLDFEAVSLENLWATIRE